LTGSEENLRLASFFNFLKKAYSEVFGSPKSQITPQILNINNTKFSLIINSYSNTGYEIMSNDE
jgi:hypothetical protein